ncbi:hypothetical protein SELMODRAFT_80457 [Selaginella moellendorffii]|uniref:Pentacotripeptide-repeat region of PRORP domain-containing protein n=1 Tax=Selaginella moellendorffii TaxID=88036 RepID=D8QXK1_SELML|nr:hypothetical protein SELMODRAFT_80457 [Selaginella moellendorffii]
MERIPAWPGASILGLISGYGEAGELDRALAIYSAIPGEDLELSTSMIHAYARNGELDPAMALFDRMRQRDLVVWSLMVSALAHHGRLAAAGDFFARMPERSIVAWRAMIQGHAQSGRSQDVARIFEDLPQRDALSWTSLIVAHANCGDLAKTRHRALIVFSKMPCWDVVAWNTIITANALKGHQEEALDFFAIMPQKNVVSWTVLIAANSHAGRCRDSIAILHSMQQCGFLPDDTTFTIVLLACAHAGLLDEARWCFELMVRDYSIQPTREHFGCLIDVLGRSGSLGDAQALIDVMPYSADNVAWGMFLSACRLHRDVIGANCAADRAIELAPTISSSYVMLASSLV